jgi:Peptidase inhibitor I78 family
MRPQCVLSLPLCLVFGLAGCGPEQPWVGAPPVEDNVLNERTGPADPCGAGRLQGLVGQPASNANVAALPGESRILYPDMAFNLNDFQQGRVTVRVDNSNVITSVRCG